MPPKPKKARTVGRAGRFSEALANASTPEPLSTDSPLVGGIAGGIAAASSGHRVREVDATSLIPHPFNDPARSEAGEGERWDELVRSIRSKGVQQPGLAVTRAAFVAARPAVADSLAPGDYVLVYGHRRRRAVIEAGVGTMPVVVDDTVLLDNGDFDAMTIENLGREDLTPLAEAHLYARYSEDLGQTQAQIADRLGVTQASVSRRLSLLTLTEEAAAALADGRLSTTAASALGGAAPYGPLRGWQRSTTDPDQDTPERHADQNAALAQILAGASPSGAARLVLTERKSRNQAASLGIAVVDSAIEALGGGPVVEVTTPAEFDGEVVGTIDDLTRALLLWGRAPVSESAPAAPEAEPAERPKEPSQGSSVAESAPIAPEAPQAPASGTPARDSKIENEPDAQEVPAADPEPVVDDAQVAAAARLEACAKAARRVPSRTQMAEVLAVAIAHGIDTTDPVVVARADTWVTDGGEDAGTYAAAAAIAWRRVLAGYENTTTAAGRHWGPTQTTYIELLTDRARGFTPTAYERRLMQKHS